MHRALFALVPLALTAACGEVSGAAGVAATASASRSAAIDAGPCPQSGIRLELSAVDQAAELRTVAISMFNCGRTPVTLHGYPRIKALGSDGRQTRAKFFAGGLGLTDLAVFEGRSATIRLAPLETVSTLLLWRRPASSSTAEQPTATTLEVIPVSGMAAQQLNGSLADLGAAQKVGTSAWVKVRDAAGSALQGDGAPHYADNNGWKRRSELSPTDKVVGKLAADRARPVLERLRRKGDISPETIRAALLAAGFSADRTFTTALRVSSLGTATTPPPGAVVDIRAGAAACITGEVRPESVELTVTGRNGEGTCVEAFAH